MQISLLLFIFSLHRIACMETSLNMVKYLDDQARIVGEELIRHSRNPENLYTVILHEVDNVKLIGNYSSGEIFTFSNESFVLLDREMYKISRDNYSVMQTFSPNEKVLFSRAAQFKRIGFLMFVTSNTVQIFGFDNERKRKKFFKIQNIVHPNVTDARFFLRRGEMYLMISSYKSIDFAPVVVYKFTNSYFDEIEKFVTPSARKLHTFGNKDVFVVVQESRMASTLYEFTQDRIRKIHKIDTKNTTDVLDYLHFGKQYVMFISVRHVHVYLWTGSDLLFFEEFITDFPLTGKKSIIYLNDHPFLITTNDTNLVIFSLTNNNFFPVHNSVLDTNWTNILNWKINGEKSLLVLGKTPTTLEVKNVSIFVEEHIPKEKIVEDEKLPACFLTLEKAVYFLRNKISDVENGTISLREAASDNFPMKKWEDFRTKYSTIKTVVEGHKKKILIINKPSKVVIPKGAKKLFAADIRFSTLNKQSWQPETWLSYNQTQRIPTSVKIQSVKTDTLKTKYNDPLINDLISSKHNQILSGSVKVNSVDAYRLETNYLNSIPMSNFYYKSQPVSIKGLKSFPDLQASEVNAAKINGADAATVVPFLAGPDVLTSNLTIDNLWVETINGVNFDKLRESVFRVGLTDTIEGNLTFKQVESKEVFFETLSKMSDVLTTSTNQTINSSITISKIFASNVTTNQINGIDFKNLAATFDDKIIEGPVSLKDLNVKNDLELKGDIKKEFLLLNDTHIVGTNESDFLQRYNGNVTIRGNLILDHFDLGPTAKMIVAGKQFNPEINQFWTKTTPQTIPVHFEAQNGMSAPHMYTNLINGVSVSDYMLNSSEQTKPGKFYFESAFIRGNVLLDPTQQHSPNLEKIQQESVRTEGIFEITGRKRYTNVLKVENLEVGNLESADKPLNDEGSNKVVNMVVKGNLQVEKLKVDKINNVNITRLREDAVYIDRPHNVSRLSFTNVTAKNIKVLSTWNKHNMTKMMSNLKKIDKIKKINAVYVKDNVSFENIDHLSTINGQDVDKILEKSRTLYNNHNVFVPTKFSGVVKVKDLTILTVNNIDLQNISRRILYKSWNQPISSRYTFTKLRTNDLITRKINDFDIEKIIDISKTESQEILAAQGLKLRENVQIQNLNGNLSCPLHESLNNLHNPLSKFWNNIVITGNATFWDKGSLIGRVFDQVVTHEKSNPMISAKVHFLENISANNITTLKNINDINVMELLEDAFVNRPNTTQIITGKKTFTQFEAQTFVGLQNTNTSTINDINISEIDSKIVSKSSIPDVPIKGQKTFFGGLQTKKIKADFISGVKTENLVSSENTTAIPNAMFESVTVEDNFNISFINKMPFEVFLNERLLRQGPKQVVLGRYFFQDVVFNENITTPRINGIDMNNVVFDVGNQIINGPKRFTKNLRIIGNMSVGYINGLDLSKSHERAVLMNEDTNFTDSVHILKPTMLEGSIHTKYINSIPVDYMLDTSANYTVQVEAQKIHDITNIIADFVKNYINITQRLPTGILYLEKSRDLQIPLPNTVSAQIIETKDDILIHVESEDDGEVCGLGPACKCPMQQTMQISSHDSVNGFVNKAMQRIYSYYSDDIIIHVITHSISSSSQCRINNTKVSNEVSTLTWNVPPHKNSSGGFFVHRAFFTGFINRVEFFTVYGRTYVVIGTYYDPVMNTHDLDSPVFRFNEEKSAVEEIQKIPTNGMKLVTLFPTAQGFILIMGNGDLEEFNKTTRIFRFDPRKEQFEILREVPSFGTIHAQGVVLKRDSLIILANKQSSLLVLKYREDYDNYYLYQTFQLNYPVSSLSTFYTEDFGISDAYLSVVTTNHEYFIYSFWFIEGWKLEFSGELEDTNILIPLKLNGKPYLFAPSRKSSFLLALVKHDSD